MNFKKAKIVAIADFFILAELTLAVYMAHRYPEYLTGAFLITFIPLAIITVVMCKRALRRIPDEEPEVNPAKVEADVTPTL
ncbi:MAG: hypothetical protein HQK55_07850 [Deltaproteobacteria bacterium]|nr:hypothetical protein [Deltaproteobacteria bacterium]